MGYPDALAPEVVVAAAVAVCTAAGIVVVLGEDGKASEVLLDESCPRGRQHGCCIGCSRLQLPGVPARLQPGLVPAVAQ